MHRNVRDPAEDGVEEIGESELVQERRAPGPAVVSENAQYGAVGWSRPVQVTSTRRRTAPGRPDRGRPGARSRSATRSSGPARARATSSRPARTTPSSPGARGSAGTSPIRPARGDDKPEEHAGREGNEAHVQPHEQGRGSRPEREGDGRRRPPHHDPERDDDEQRAGQLRVDLAREDEHRVAERHGGPGERRVPPAKAEIPEQAEQLVREERGDQEHQQARAGEPAEPDGRRDERRETDAAYGAQLPGPV